MTRDLLLGLDLGTSSVKALLITPQGEVLASEAVEYEISSPFPGWAEQDPEAWYDAACLCLRRLAASASRDLSAVAAMGLSGQMHGLVCLDGKGQALRPALIWADARSAPQVERVKEQLGQEFLAQQTGNPLAAGFMLPSWLWVRENEPLVATSTRSLLLPKDFIRFRLTGQTGAEPSDASSTSLFNPSLRAWSQPLLDALDIDPALLPPLADSAALAGELTLAAAEDCCLPAGLPVVYGASDQACQAVGHGVVAPGLLSSTIGTGGQIFAPLDTPVFDPLLRLHLFCHALPERWHHQAAILAAGLSLKWLRDRFFPGEHYSTLADWAAQAPAGSEGLFYTPYLLGERTPHMDPHAAASFVGLTLRHDRPHLVRAVMEGVVFALRQGLDLMLELGTPAERVVASGGALRHPLWLQLQANIFNRPIYQTETLEAAAFGAALLAGVGAAIFPSVEEGCRSAVRFRPQIIEPDPSPAAVYAERYPLYNELYQRTSLPKY